MAQSREPVEIDEVLTSIRRLVGEGTNPVVGQNNTVQDDQLVLTPALRIAEADVLPPLQLTSPKDSWEDSPLDDRVLRLENAVSAASGNWTPIVNGASSVAEEPLELTSPLQPVSETPVSLQGEDFDEAQLRTLIAEVLREELRGDIGDKLSQNLRKVVRREIARALTERDQT